MKPMAICSFARCSLHLVYSIDIVYAKEDKEKQKEKNTNGAFKSSKESCLNAYVLCRRSVVVGIGIVAPTNFYMHTIR